MATEVDITFLTNQLKSKLNKDELIHIILNKELPQGVRVPEAVEQQLEVVLHGECAGGCENNSPNKAEVKLADLQQKTALLERLVNQMEERIGEQKLLISMLSNSTVPSQVSTDKTVKILKSFHSENASSLANNKYSRKSLCENNIIESAPVTENTTRNTEHGTKKPPVIIRGSAPVPSVELKPSGFSDNSFAAAARRAYLYVGNVNINATEESLVAYLKSKYPEKEFVVEALPVRDNAQSKSFKLVCDFTLLESLNSPESWSNGIIVKRFFRITKT